MMEWILYVLRKKHSNHSGNNIGLIYEEIEK